MRPVNDTWVVASVSENALEERKKIFKGASVSIHRTKVRVVYLMDSLNKIQVQPVMQLKQTVSLSTLSMSLKRS